MVKPLLKVPEIQVVLAFCLACCIKLFWTEIISCAAVPPKPPSIAIKYVVIQILPIMYSGVLQRGTRVTIQLGLRTTGNWLN